MPISSCGVFSSFISYHRKCPLFKWLLGCDRLLLVVLGLWRLLVVYSYVNWLLYIAHYCVEPTKKKWLLGIASW